MDYGTTLKREQGNPNKRSAHYTLQAAFEGSNRQVRSRILKTLLQQSPLLLNQIVAETGIAEERIAPNLVGLEKEGFLTKHGNRFFIADVRSA